MERTVITLKVNFAACTPHDIYIFHTYDCIVPELLLSNSRHALSTTNGRVYVIETDGTELERNVDFSHMNIDTGLIYAMEVNLETGKIYFSNRNTSTLWTASLDDEIRATDDRQVSLSININSRVLIKYIQFLACYQ